MDLPGGDAKGAGEWQKSPGSQREVDYWFLVSTRFAITLLTATSPVMSFLLRLLERFDPGHGVGDDETGAGGYVVGVCPILFPRILVSDRCVRLLGVGVGRVATGLRMCESGPR